MAVKYALCALILFTVATQASAKKLMCIVESKIDVLSGTLYSEEQMQRMRFSLRLYTNAQTLSRCSFQQSAGAVTCDTYGVDRVEVAAGLVDIKKYYYFAGQFDLQIFNDAKFIENNGRGSIATGYCVKM